jgi:hypothetical protein
MAYININSFNYKIDNGTEQDVKFINKNPENQKLPSFLISENKNVVIKKKILMVRFLGAGSYGSVFKIKINDNYYAIKLSENEIPDKLLRRYKSLCQNEKLEKHIIKIFSCGEILKPINKYKYYCIMEYGGQPLKSAINNFTSKELKLVLKQLYNIVHESSKFRLLITDFKLGNLTINNKNKIKLVDIYMDCDNYSPCTSCKIVKTYSTVEIDKEKRIYEDPSYNYSGIYIQFAICLIDILSENGISKCTYKLGKKFNLNISVKQIIPILQIACYNYNNNSLEPLKNYKNVEKFKKMVESEFKFLKTNEFYEYFLSLLEPKENYEMFINKKRLILIINDLLTLDPKQRSLKFLKEKLSTQANDNFTSNLITGKI